MSELDLLLKKLQSLVIPGEEMYLRRRADDAMPDLKDSFGGMPYMEAGEDWPVCQTCRNPLDFICQLNLNSPYLESKYTFLTFFYCWECNPVDEIDENAGMYQVRFYKKPSQQKFIPKPVPEEAVTLSCYVKSSSLNSLPDWAGLSLLHPKFFAELNEHEDSANFYEHLVEQVTEIESYSFKGGYPQFIEFAEFPSCGQCNKEMKLLVQIDSEEEAELIWGDSGCAYLFYCSSHPYATQLKIQF